MINIPPHILTLLHKSLLDCGPFNTEAVLRATFTDVRISQWRHQISHAPSPDARVKMTVDYLRQQYDSQQNNALINFLAVLLDQTTPMNACHQQLQELIDTLKGLETCDEDQPLTQNVTLDKYRQHIQLRYGYTRVLGQARPIPLDDIFTDIYMLEEPLAFRRFDITQLENSNAPLNGLERVPGKSILTAPLSQRLFILGKPGAGKTTFLKHVALEAARDPNGLVPMFVALKEWNDSDASLLDFIVQQFAICKMTDATNAVEQLLDTSQAIVLFDGLDEINQAEQQRSRAIAEIQTFAQRYAQVQILMTCRIAATDYTFEQFTYVEMADFNQSQWTSFVHKWFADNPVKRDAFLEEIVKEEHRGLRELGQTPLLLTMLCLAFADNMIFPRRRVDIYIDALDALLRKWDSSRNIRRDKIYRTLSPVRKHQLFARIAVETFENNKPIFPQTQLEQQVVHYLQRLPQITRYTDVDIDGTVILKAIEMQHGVLVERAHRIYAFAHLTFQEYYAAHYIVEHIADGTLARLIHEHFTDKRWREVILITASLLDNATPFFHHAQHKLTRIIAQDATLIQLLDWAAQKGHEMPYASSDLYSGVYLRSFYTHLALELAITRALRYALTASHARILSQTLVRARSYQKHMEHQHALPPHGVLDQALIQALDLTLDHTLTEHHSPKLDQAQVRLLSQAIQQAKKLCQSLHFSTLYAHLQKLDVPTVQDNLSAWKKFGQHLQQLIFNERNIGNNWELNWSQIETLETYLYAANLMVLCLDLAYLTNRATTEAGLLLPTMV